MITVRRAEERGQTNIGWLDSHHTFSFGDYYDPRQLGFSKLRVINDDRVAPAKGFGTHPHRDMEIISYVVSGALMHKDSMGNGSVIARGDVQRMSAGTGVLHSEFNPSKDEPVHFLQIWILPDETGLEPSYEQRRFSEEERRGRLRLVAAKDGKDGAVVVHQDVRIYAGLLAEGETANISFAEGRRAWVQVAGGSISVNGLPLEEGDGAAATDETVLTISGAKSVAEVLVFDLP
jgi:redox-sensitive bicupin YhaK (pirin superfamily)